MCRKREGRGRKGTGPGQGCGRVWRPWEAAGLETRGKREGSWGRSPLQRTGATVRCSRPSGLKGHPQHRRQKPLSATSEGQREGRS